MTGQGEDKFADVVAKELMDNALDACETSGIAPEIALAVEEHFSGEAAITVTDNAGGIPHDTVHGALDFHVLVSDKAAYRSPTRGAQGNALKTVFANPPAWLPKQLEKCRENPELHMNSLCTAVAAQVLGDGDLGNEVREEVEKVLGEERDGRERP